MAPKPKDKPATPKVAKPRGKRARKEAARAPKPEPLMMNGRLCWPGGAELTAEERAAYAAE
jgi:hypothetical protein